MSNLPAVREGGIASQNPGDVLREFVTMGRLIHAEANEVNDDAHVTSWYLRFCASIGHTFAANIREYVGIAEGIKRDFVFGKNERFFRFDDDWHVMHRRWNVSSKATDYSFSELRHRKRSGYFTGVSIERGSLSSNWVQSISKVYDVPTSRAEIQIGSLSVHIGDDNARWGISPIEGLGELVCSIESIPGIGKQVELRAPEHQTPLFNGEYPF